MPTVFNGLNHSVNQAVFFNNPTVTGPIVIEDDGLVTERRAAYAMRLDGGAYNVGIYGLCESTKSDGYGIRIDVSWVYSGSGKRSAVDIFEGGEIKGFYALLTGHATDINNQGSITGHYGIYASDMTQNYTIMNSGSIVSEHAITASGAGIHTISNSGTITGDIKAEFVPLIASIERISNTGTLNGDIAVSAGNDVVRNSGFIVGDVYLDSGDDKLINSGSITGDISCREDNDTIINSGAIVGLVSMGTGDDVFRGGVTSELVTDESGNDTYYLGGGNDVFLSAGHGSEIGVDLVYGGLNARVNIAAGVLGDMYNGNGATGSFVINLNSSKCTDLFSGIVYQAQQASGNSTGTDRVVGFEAVQLGMGQDIAFGNDLANYIAGNSGDDRLFGGAGNDHLYGDIGKDRLVGGLGGDHLYGGAFTEGDRFVYTAMNESAVAGLGRDVLDKIDVEDRIDFTRVSEVDLHFIGEEVDFDGSLGALRVISSADGWLVQVDVDGNKSADFAISILDADHDSVLPWGRILMF